LEAFGDARLHEVLAAIEDGPRGAVERIVATVDEFAAGAEQSDDICVLAVRRLSA
jgi:serine phosphatase RsbU (regulator of sigma subunit)